MRFFKEVKMTVETRAKRKAVVRKATKHPIFLVWGTREKGIGIERDEHKGKNRYWWNVVHIKNGKVILVHRDYPSKTKAIKEAEGYGRYEQKHPRSGFIK